LIKKKGTLIDDLYHYEGNRKVITKAITHYKILDINNYYSLLELNPETGRKHQLRKQLYSIGHPIYGDQKYKLNYSEKAINKNLMLHSYQIKFMINKKKFTYTALLPEYFKKLLKIKRLSFPSF
jgi:23S rRNA pseudouridine955/2504/2580 synthase